MTYVEILYYVCIPAIAMLAVLLLTLSNQIFVTELNDPLPPPPPYVPRHVDIDTTYEHSVPFEEDVEAWPSVGRRSIDSPVRYTIVPRDWMPCIGDIRIALLETPTAEYLFARKPVDQLDTTRTQFMRRYMASAGAGID